ncbi:MAG: amidophosphoribosyltransferase [Candidatus Altiarchaeales archaeon]|nr:amidophosphoribosyltransferase [Candidatus Altiarchaeales archaeon]MBD3416433.1 amidophosphoribosyltransferase [Candidatus Altiarchaeales archaeon]
MSGLFGVIGGADCTSKLFVGVDYHSHLGTQYGGLAVLNGENRITKKIHDIQQSQFKGKFYQDLQDIEGKAGIGVISDSNEQPLVFESKFGTYALCTNGLIENKSEIASELIENGETFSEYSKDGVNPAELVATMISKGDDIVDGIGKMYDQIQGSITLLLLNKDGVYAARDRKGRFPLVVGEGDGFHAVTSESCAFSNLGLKAKKHVGPDEIVLLTEKGVKTVKKEGEDNRICSFMWIYTGFPASDYEGINAEEVRERCGKALAARDSVKADMAAGIPDSGVAHAIGYAIGAGVPFRRPMVKYTPGYGRSYTPPSQETRDQIALMKLIPNEKIIKGKSIVICEDSIVRGTQLKNYTLNKLYNSGAREIHIRVACPPLMFPCKYNLSTKTLEELAARKAIKSLEGDIKKNVDKYLDSDSDEYAKMVEWINNDLGSTSLMYQRLEDMIEAIGLPREKLCLYCWNGRK